MLGVLKKGVTDLVLKTKDLFTSPKSQVYVKDLRKVMVYKKDGRKCQYPKNYDEIVKSGEIIENKDMRENPILDKDKNPTYKLLYGEKDKDGRQSSFELTKITEIGGKSYFTINFLVDPDKREFHSGDHNYYSEFYKPFKFSKIDLKKHIPVFEVDTNSLKLTNSSVLAKKGCSINNDTGEVDEKDRDEKGRNGELLYTSDYKKLNTSFSEVRDQSGNLELDKSLISVPIVFATSLAKVCTKLLTSLPIKLGENLISKQNPIAKSFGYLLFIPSMAIKNLVNMGATILKAPILLFVANEKKYGDAYFTMWKHQLKECWEEAKSDFNVIKGEERLKPDHGNRDSLVGTWDELNARRPKKQGNDKEVSKSNEILKSPEEEQNKGNEILSDKRKGHVEELQNRRNSQQGQGATHDHSH